MAFEYLSLIADVDTDTGKGILFTGIGLVTGAIGWWAQKVWEPGIRERRDRREREFNAKLDREERIAVATIEEMKVRTVEEKAFRDATERRRQEEEERRMAAQELRGSREAIYTKSLDAVAVGQDRTRERLDQLENETTRGFKDTKVVLKAILNHLRIEYEWDEEVRQTPADGQPTSGGTM